MKKAVLKVIHNGNLKKRDKIVFSTKLSTLSTKMGITLWITLAKKEQTFCSYIIKIIFCRKKFDKNLDF